MGVSFKKMLVGITLQKDAGGATFAKTGQILTRWRAQFTAATFSTSIAMPWPPPMQADATP